MAQASGMLSGAPITPDTCVITRGAKRWIQSLEFLEPENARFFLGFILRGRRRHCRLRGPRW